MDWTLPWKKKGQYPQLVLAGKKDKVGPLLAHKLDQVCDNGHDWVRGVRWMRETEGWVRWDEGCPVQLDMAAESGAERTVAGR